MVKYTELQAKELAVLYNLGLEGDIINGNF